MSDYKIKLFMPRRCEFPDGAHTAHWFLSSAGCEPARSGEYRREDAPVCHDITCRVCYTDKQRETSSRRREILDKMAREAQEAGFYDLD